MTNAKRKSLYLFLTSLLGILLLLMFHRSLFVIYDILGSFFPANQLLSLKAEALFTLDFFTMIIAMFIGGWYGIWLGLDWYKMIYEERDSREWFHGFLPHSWRGYHARKHAKKPNNEFAQFAQTTQSRGTESRVPKSIVVKNARVASPRIESFSSFKTAPQDTAWSFDDVQAPLKPKRKVVAKKRVVKKRATTKSGVKATTKTTTKTSN